MPHRRTEFARPAPVPAELGGKWIAWNAEHTQIVAQADTMQQLRRMTLEQRIVAE